MTTGDPVVVEKVKGKDSLMEHASLGMFRANWLGWKLGSVEETKARRGGRDAVSARMPAERASLSRIKQGDALAWVALDVGRTRG